MIPGRASLRGRARRARVQTGAPGLGEAGLFVLPDGASRRGRQARAVSLAPQPAGARLGLRRIALHAHRVEGQRDRADHRRLAIGVGAAAPDPGQPFDLQAFVGRLARIDGRRASAGPRRLSPSTSMVSQVLLGRRSFSPPSPRKISVAALAERQRGVAMDGDIAGMKDRLQRGLRRNGLRPRTSVFTGERRPRTGFISIMRRVPG